MGDKKTIILDNFHNAMSELSRANLMYHYNYSHQAVFPLKTTKAYIDKLIQEIEDE